MEKEYSYDLYNELGRVKGGKITEEEYMSVVNRKDIKLKQEWETKYTDRTLYGKMFVLNEKNKLFIWKEVK